MTKICFQDLFSMLDHVHEDGTGFSMIGSEGPSISRGGIQESPNDVPDQLDDIFIWLVVWNMNGLYHQLVIFGYGHQSMFIGICNGQYKDFQDRDR